MQNLVLLLWCITTKSNWYFPDWRILFMIHVGVCHHIAKTVRINKHSSDPHWAMRYSTYQEHSISLVFFIMCFEPLQCWCPSVWKLCKNSVFWPFSIVKFVIFYPILKYYFSYNIHILSILNPNMISISIITHFS